MYKCFLGLMLAFLQMTASAQDFSKKNEIFLELAGNGLLGSLNYARQLTKNPGLELRAGLGAYGSEKTFITIPVSLNYSIGLDGQHTFLTIGMGATYTKADVRIGRIIDYEEGYQDTHSAPVNLVPSLAYRYYTSKDFLWKIAFTPVINKHGFLPSLGLSAGKRF
jgi:hypothetical protein